MNIRFIEIRKQYCFLLLISGLLISVSIKGSQPWPNTSQQFNGDIPMNCSPDLFKAALKSRQSLHSASEGKYVEALNCLHEAAEGGDEFAIRYLAHSYKNGGLLTGFSRYQYERFKNMEKALVQTAKHKGFLKSLVRMAEQRLVSAFNFAFPEYKELAHVCNIPTYNNQTFVSPYLVMMKLFEKYLATDEINQYWNALETIVTRLNSDQLYELITMVTNDHIAKQYPLYTETNRNEKERDVVNLITKHAMQNKPIEMHFRQLEFAIYSVTCQSSTHDPFFASIIKQIEFCYLVDREFALRNLENLLIKADNVEARHYCVLLHYTSTRDRCLFDYYASNYLSKHLTDLMKFALTYPDEMKPFEGTVLSIDAIIARAFETAQQRTNVEALRCFLLLGSRWYARYDIPIREIFRTLFYQRDKLYDGILALLKSANTELKTYCFEILVEQLADLEHSIDNNYWVDKLFSDVDLSGIYAQTPFAAYMYCRNKFIEMNAPMALQSLEAHFPAYS